MLRMFARRMSQVDVVVGTDRVFAGLNLPSGSTLNNVNLDVIIQGNRVAEEKAVFYAIEGYVLPVFDPDSAPTFDTLWDQQVPKDTDVEAVDLDTAASDATPFSEPGEPDWTALLDIGHQPKRIYQRQRLMTLGGGNSVFSFQDNQTPFDALWIPGDRVSIRLRKRIRVEGPSVVVFALANPSLDDTTTTEAVGGLGAFAEAHWGQMKYAGHMLERALLHLIGLTEAGAESPWEEATNLLGLALEPNVFEETAGRFVQTPLQVTMRGMFDFSVTGRIDQVAVGTGR